MQKLARCNYVAYLWKHDSDDNENDIEDVSDDENDSDNDYIA